MFRFLLVVLTVLLLTPACAPPVRLKPARVETGLDSTFYAGVVENPLEVDLRRAKYLASVKVGDLGVSLDCTYPDALDNATREARRIGGNLLVLTEHTRFQTKSRCHRIKGDIYQIGSLEGLEARIDWNLARPLLPGDLRGKAPAGAAGLPPVLVKISCRIGGDYFNTAILKTETAFIADSTFAYGDSVQQARQLLRAQCYFNLAEVHARRLKARLLELGPDVSALTGKFRDFTAEQQTLLREEMQVLDANLQGLPAEWLLAVENRLSAELQARADLAEDQTVDLRKRKK